MSNYAKGEYEFILEGRLKHGTQRPEHTEPPTFDTVTALRSPTDAAPYAVHCAVFVLNWASLTNDAAHARLRHFISIAQTKGSDARRSKLGFLTELTLMTAVPVIVAVTQIDHNGAHFRVQPLRLLADADIQGQLDPLSTKLGVPRRDIIPVMSYLNEATTEPALDYLALSLLRRVVDLADDRLLAKCLLHDK